MKCSRLRNAGQLPHPNNVLVRSICNFGRALILGVFLASRLAASDTSISIEQQAVDTDAKITVYNGSASSVRLMGIETELAAQFYAKSLSVDLAAGQSLVYKFQVGSPRHPGSYAQRTTVYYENKGESFSLSTLGYFDHLFESRGVHRPYFPKRFMRERGMLYLEAYEGLDWRLIVPKEIQSKSRDAISGVLVYDLWAEPKGVRIDYPVFAVSEAVENGVHSATIAKTSLTVDTRAIAFTGRAPDFLLCVISLLSFIACAFVYRGFAQTASWPRLGYFAPRVFLATVAYLILRHLAGFFYFLSELHPSIHVVSVEIADHFASGSFGHFFTYFSDLYLMGVILYPLLRVCVVGGAYKIESDKYASALAFPIYAFWRRFLNLPAWSLPNWKFGWLATAVKFFYLPLLSGWVINNTIHQWNLVNAFSLGWRELNVFLVALFIYVDTVVFCVGYTLESRKLGSEIKTVDTSWLGWLACLACYPPFNFFTFNWFDRSFLPVHLTMPDWIMPVATCLITLGWGVFTWASLSLGFKASNLTNRGVVVRGPYRYCRHPAYTAKMLIFFIQAMFFGDYTSGMLISLIAIYLLRAWTEERHLSKDPDYLAYKTKVPWRMIPRIF